jgi:putative transposase
MSRLRRPFLYDRFIFVTVKLLPSRTRLEEGDFERLANSFTHMREKHGFLLTAWVFLPDHWHAIVHPPYPLTISTALKSVKTSSRIGINVRRRECGELWQERFFDRALRTVREYHEKVEYIHLNPVRRGLVKNPEDWKWSSMREFAGVSGEDQERFCGLRIDRLPLPFDVHTRI